MPRALRRLFLAATVLLILGGGAAVTAMVRGKFKWHSMPEIPSTFGTHFKYLGDDDEERWWKPGSLLPWAVLGSLAGLVVVRMARATVLDHYRSEFRAQALATLALASRRGQSLTPCLIALRDDFEGPRARAAERIARGLDSGLPLSESMATGANREFPLHVVEAIRAAEVAGRVPEALEAAARDGREEPRTRSRVRLALFYPMLLLTAGAAMGVLLPDPVQVQECLSGLPAPRYVNSMSYGVAAAFLSLLTLVLVLTLLLMIRLLRDGRTRRTFRPILDPMLLRIPGVGGAVRLGASSRLLRSLAALVRAGTPLDQAFERAAPSAGNRSVENSADRTAEALRSGVAFPTAVASLAVPAFARTRLAASAGGAPAQFAAAIDALAQECADRRRRREEALTDAIYPASVILCGAIAFAQYAALFMYEEGAREVARMRYLPW